LATVLVVALLASTAAADAGSVVITQRDSGKRFVLARSGTATLRLSHNWVWTHLRTSTGAVELTQVDFFRDPGYDEWTIDAVHAGTAVITATGRPKCAPCGLATRRFRVTLVVR
jgi:hypothetical protein